MSSKKSPKVQITFGGLTGSLILAAAKNLNFTEHGGILSQQKTLKWGNTYTLSAISTTVVVQSITFGTLSPDGFTLEEERKIKTLERKLRKLAKEQASIQPAPSVARVKNLKKAMNK